MKYRIRAHPTTYAGVNFRSRLEARWAAFFNCMKWKWEYEPVDLYGWTPDFKITIGMHRLLVEIKPYSSVEQFKVHPCMNTDCGDLADTTAGFGLDPSVTIFRKSLSMLFCSLQSLCDPAQLHNGWIAAGNLTQWKKRKKHGTVSKVRKTIQR